MFVFTPGLHASSPVTSCDHISRIGSLISGLNESFITSVFYN